MLFYIFINFEELRTKLNTENKETRLQTFFKKKKKSLNFIPVPGLSTTTQSDQSKSTNFPLFHTSQFPHFSLTTIDFSDFTQHKR